MDSASHQHVTHIGLCCNRAPLGHDRSRFASREMAASHAWFPAPELRAGRGNSQHYLSYSRGFLMELPSIYHNVFLQCGKNITGRMSERVPTVVNVPTAQMS